MTIDLRPFFKKYEALVSTVDQVFEKVKDQHLDCVNCHQGCSDCCHALFDLSLIEALYINHVFNERFSGAEKAALLEIANKTDRETYKIKRKAYKDLEAGKREEEIIEQITKERVRCALLDDLERCVLYEHRPITCRFYGIPTAIGGVGRTCGLSGFEEGKKYPTVNLDAIHKQLYQLSEDVVRHLRTEHVRMAEVLVPLSMALLTTYDEEHLGVKNEEGDGQDNDAEGNENG